MENVQRDGEVDIFKFPIPFVHEHDGGRYIGTEDLVVMRDPDSDWINVGTYRIVAHAKDEVGIWISPGKHGRLIREKYFARESRARCSSPAARTRFSSCAAMPNFRSAFPSSTMRAGSAAGRSRSC